MSIKKSNLFVGQKLRCLKDGADDARVNKGSIVTVTELAEGSRDFGFTVDDPIEIKWRGIQWVGLVEDFEEAALGHLVDEPVVDLKFDGGKPKWSLLVSAQGMLAALTGVLNVLTFGAKKYKEHSWRKVADSERRYMDALIRHLIEIQTHGLDARDKESGELHIDHVNCNGLFLGELARK